MTDKLTIYDPAAALVDDEEIAFFMADALATGDLGYIAKCVGVVARAKGMANIQMKPDCRANNSIARSAKTVTRH